MVSTAKRTRLTKRVCLLLLQGCKSMEQLKQIHCQIFRSCLHETRDVTDDLMTFCIGPETGNLHYGEKVLYSLGLPALFHYNLVFKAFAKKGSLKKVLLLYDRLRENGMSPDNFTYPFVLKATGELGAVREGKKVHGSIVKSGLEFDLYVRNSLMGMYAQMQSVGTSQLLFDEMPDRDVVSWNVLIAGYVKCQMFEEAISIFQKMKDEGFKPDEATMVITLSACIPLGNLELGKKIHCFINEHYQFSIVLGNALLDMYVKCGGVIMARKFFDEMPVKNVISWTTIVSGYVNCGQLDDARELFERSPTKDVVIWTAMINGHVQFNRFDDALAMFREMQMEGTRPDKFTVATLLTVCARLGALEQGKWIHGYIEERMIKIDAVVGTALVDMYAKCGWIKESVEIFKKIEGKDTAAWSAVICGLAMNGKTCNALSMFSEMKIAGARPDDITYIGVLSACSHGRLVEEGRHHFNEMERIYEIEPKLEHYGCLVDLLGRAGLLNEAEKLIESIPRKDNIDTLPLWGALLGACRIHGNVNLSERVATQFEGFHSSDSGIQTLLANIFAAANRWEDVMKVRREMRDLGFKKTPGCSSIEIDGVIHEFLVGDASHPQTGEIYSALRTVGRIMELEEVVELQDAK